MNESVNELLYMYRTGDQYAFHQLHKIYRPSVDYLVNRYIRMIPSMQSVAEDLKQEGMIAVFTAINTYRYDRDATFETYVNILIKRRLYNASRFYISKVSVNGFWEIGLSNEIMENRRFYTTEYNSPEYALQFNEANRKLNKTVRKMKEIDRKVVETWKNDYTYLQASQKLGITEKSYDARLQKVRKKIRKALYEEDDN